MSNSPAPGATGNVVAALCSFFIPGLGQLIQGRIFMALVMFALAVFFWIITLGHLGWIINLVACINAALYRGRS